MLVCELLLICEPAVLSPHIWETILARALQKQWQVTKKTQPTKTQKTYSKGSTGKLEEKFFTLFKMISMLHRVNEKGKRIVCYLLKNAEWQFYFSCFISYIFQSHILYLLLNSIPYEITDNKRYFPVIEVSFCGNSEKHKDNEMSLRENYQRIEYKRCN